MCFANSFYIHVNHLITIFKLNWKSFFIDLDSKDLVLNILVLGCKSYIWNYTAYHHAIHKNMHIWIRYISISAYH